ncbi:retrovirus-related pol polyprotein from transposon TNT 1-94 [Tanacetum coccineum]
MDFLTVVASSRFPLTNNQLRTSSNPRNQATIQDGRVTMQQVEGRQGKSYANIVYKGNATSSGGNNAGGQTRVVKCYNCQGEGHMARQCTQPKRPRNAAWFKEKAMLAEAQEAGPILDEEELAFLVDPGIPDGQAAQTNIPNTAAFQTEDLDAYDSDCDDVSNEMAVPMANISNYGSDIISEKAQRIKPTLYDSNVISCQHAASHVIDDEETLILEEILVNIFFPQQELSDEQAFWLQTSHPNTNQSVSSPVKIEAHWELLKVSLVNLDTVVKKWITPDAITEGEWGFEHTKTVFLNKIILFLKTLKDIFNDFDKDLLNEVTEVQTVFNQMEADVQQYFVDKQYIMICAMNSTTVFDDVNVEMKSSESCVKCLDLDADLLNKQNAYNDLSKSYSQLEKYFISLELTMQLNQEIFQKDSFSNSQNALEIPEYFENNDLKAQLQAKDTTICNLG